MGFAEEMLNLGEKLVTSHENRVGYNKNMLRRFHNEHNQMARHLRNNLNEFTENLNDNVTKLRRRFRGEHKAMAKDQRENLGEFTNDLTRNVKGFIKKCHGEQMKTYNMFALAHKNFTNCMKELERKKRHASFREESEPSAHRKRAGRRRKRTRH